MRRSGQYGDLPELQAAADFYGVNIHIYSEANSESPIVIKTAVKDI